MSTLKRFRDVENGIDGAENILNKWLKKKDIKIIRWQIIPYSFPYSTPMVFGTSWDTGIDLFIEYKSVVS